MRRLFFVCLALVVCACAGPEAQMRKERASQNHYELGVAHLLGGDVKLAIQELSQAVELTPGDPQAHNALGLALLQDRRFDLAIASFQKAVQLDASFSDAYNNLGTASFQMGNLEEAIAAFRKALANPRYLTPERSYLNLGSVYLVQG